MRKDLSVILCWVFLGGWVVLAWQTSSFLETPLAAQEPGRWPATASPVVPRIDLPNAAAAQSVDPSELTPEERVNVFVYQEVNRGVVNINTKATQGVIIEFVSEGEGSGSVLDRAGHILTSYHVVEGAREIRVTLFDGNSYDAKLIGGDIDSDVAVLKINAPPESLFPVTFGSSSRLMVGQRVFAIGNPFGLERTLTTGIVSSLNRSLPSRRSRSFRTMRSIIQIDAAVNPGNSGGPLLDGHARLIGMNMAIASNTGENTGVAFAIPVDTIARVVPQLIQNGRVRRPDSGITKVGITDRGLQIIAMTPGGPAERAGLQGPRIEKQQKRQGLLPSYESVVVNRNAADLIVAVDGQPIKNADDFLNAIETKQAGSQVVLTVIRAGQQKQIPLRLDVGE